MKYRRKLKYFLTRVYCDSPATLHLNLKRIVGIRLFFFLLLKNMHYYLFIKQTCFIIKDKRKLSLFLTKRHATNSYLLVNGAPQHEWMYSSTHSSPRH
jgi:hypothetical protein